MHLESSSVYSEPDETYENDDKKEVSNKDVVEVYDESIEVQSIYDDDGLDSPVFLGFAGPNDILVYEKQGFIKRVIDGDLIKRPVLKLDTQSGNEIFMKGIISKDTTKDEIVTHYIFLYYTQCDPNDDCRDLVYRYELDDKNNILLNAKLLFSLKTFKDSIEDQGIIRLAPDNNLHLDIKNVQKISGYDDSGTLNEIEKGKMSWTECFIQTNLGNDFNDKLTSENEYIGLDHGHGLSGSFGADFDPYSGELWYLEDGLDNADEIRMLLQPSDNNNLMKTDPFKQVNKNENFFCIDREYYDDLKHTEEADISLKSLLFLHTQYLGKKNSDNLLVSSDTNQIFQFDLDRNRSNLIIPTKSQDIQASVDTKDAKQFVFAEGFNGLLDVRLNPYDGLLYVLDKNTDEEDDSTATIYRFEKKGSKNL
ncbi:MAG TPA: PQQ-dependent sugar dehydrogenase [Nitrososphaeraceae archaeon]|nr:PQQ-dependent sugar dehydrogenase [Nitrososphaeraceae archaeon]